MLQVGAALPVEIDHIVQNNGQLFLERILALTQPNFWRTYVSVEPDIFRGFIPIPTLCWIRLEVGDYEFSFIQISGILEK